MWLPSNLFCFHRLIGNFLCDSTEYCFVVEDEAGVCGYALACIDAKEAMNRLNDRWVPAMCEKYPKPASSEGLNPSEVSIVNSLSPIHIYPHFFTGNHRQFPRSPLANS